MFSRGAIARRRTERDKKLTGDFVDLTVFPVCIVGLMASGKRLWRQVTNPIAPRKFLERLVQIFTK